MSGPSRRLSAWVWLAAIALSIAAGSFWGGCTVTKHNYKVLSFFFDGVPDPDQPAGGVAVLRPGATSASFVVVHKPYADENCEACHKSRTKPSRNDARACLECHPGVQNEHERMHGPVTVGACLWCHAPHESAHPALLRDADRKVCGQCHTPDLLESSRVPAHADGTRACLECHSGHGASGPYLLRPGAGPDTPPPQPSGATPGGK